MTLLKGICLVVLFRLVAIDLQGGLGLGTGPILAAESSVLSSESQQPGIGSGSARIPSPQSRATLSGSPLQQQVRQRLQELDADSFFLRQQARQELEELLAQPDQRSVVAEAIRHTLGNPAISVEVRYVLDSFRRRFPEAFVPPAPAEPPSQAEIEKLVQQLESDSYALRQGAAEQLKSYLEWPESAGRVLAVFRTRLAQGHISADLRRWIDPLWERAWGAWLASDSSANAIPPARPEEIEHYLDILARPTPAHSPEASQTLREAQRQLRTLLARDDQVALIRQAVQRRLNSGELPLEAQTRLTELADLCRPAMVAEFWQQGQHRGIQHLLVGVPSQVQGAPRPSHFDYIDDSTAHCVSGSNLTPGHYPVGVAVPHPHQIDAFFHLVNLPTPRRRMAYEYLVQRDLRVRLSEITQRTGQYYTRRQQPLSEREILVLVQLDPHGVSRFAGEFLRRMPDEHLSDQEGQTVAGRTSRHGLLCMVLAHKGTQEAAPGLLQAIADGRILPPTAEAPYAWPWIAALAIARRNPWPDVDRWLVEMIPRTDPLRLSGPPSSPGPHLWEEVPVWPPQPDPNLPSKDMLPGGPSLDPKGASSEEEVPQLGATAAALLLRRHEQASSLSPLLPVADPLLKKWCDLQGYRFPNPQSPQEILRWWKNRQLLRTSAG